MRGCKGEDYFHLRRPYMDGLERVKGWRRFWRGAERRRMANTPDGPKWCRVEV